MLQRMLKTVDNNTQIIIKLSLNFNLFNLICLKDNGDNGADAENMESDMGQFEDADPEH